MYITIATRKRHSAFDYFELPAQSTHPGTAWSRQRPRLKLQHLWHAMPAERNTSNAMLLDLLLMLKEIQAKYVLVVALSTSLHSKGMKS
jgi:hypothetical protein